ncbi:MAG: nucleotide pyrophosphatase, partial [Rhodobacteraceae bacterium]
GIINNAFHQPQVLSGKAIDTSSFEHLSLAQDLMGEFVTASSLGQALAARGLSMSAVHCGTAGAAYLVNHKAAANGHATFSVQGEEFSQTPQAVREVIARLGPLPGKDIPKFDVVDYAGRAMEQVVLGADQPDVSLVWLPEPDTSFHYREIGSDASRAVMGAADEVFGRILDTVRNGPHADRTAVIAMSDHGQITITDQVDLAGLMAADGLSAATAPEAGTEIALTLGNSGELRMLADNPALVSRAAEWLMSRDEIGMVFARDDLADAVPGALPLSLVHQSHDRAPELFYVMLSDDGADQNNLPGTTLCSGGPPVGGGMHGGLNRYEMNTTLMISAPGVARDVISHEPCALIDIAPTVLSLLGIAPDGMAGRVLALDGAVTNPESEWIHAERGSFHQHLVRKHVEGRIYLDSGGRD